MIVVSLFLDVIFVVFVDLMWWVILGMLFEDDMVVMDVVVFFEMSFVVILKYFVVLVSVGLIW